MIDENKLIKEIKNRRDFWLSKTSKYDEVKDEINTDISDGKAMELEVVVKMIQEQPKAGEWVPCSERLPIFSGFYLTTVNDYGNFYVDKNYFYNSSLKWTDICNGEEVIAWQPLPEPAKE